MNDKWCDGRWSLDNRPAWTIVCIDVLMFLNKKKNVEFVGTRNGNRNKDAFPFWPRFSLSYFLCLGQRFFFLFNRFSLSLSSSAAAAAAAGTLIRV